MKRIILYIFLIVVFTLLGVIGMGYEKIELPDNILNKVYYKYNNLTGFYDSIKFTSKKVTYEGEELDLEGCSEYQYTSLNGIVKFSCGHALKIISGTSEVLAITMNNNNYYFFTSKENSFEYQFREKFNMTYSEYKNTSLNKEKEITEEKLNELIDSLTTSYVYINTDKCDYTCALVEDKLNTLDNSYYINIDNITREDILNSISDSTKPIILTLGKGYVKKTTINIKGFNIEELTNYLKETENEEENN